MRKKACLVFFVMLVAVRVFPEDNANRLLNLLEDVLGAAVESGKPSPPQSPHPPSETPSFYLLNKTGFTVKEVYVTQTQSEDWGSNVFQGHLYNGQTVLITLRLPLSAADRYNIRLVDADGDHYSKYDVPITEYGTVEISISEYDQ
jgi:hypothetical protein